MSNDQFPSNQISSINVSRNRPLALVVGAAGFIGSHLVEGLLEKDVQVIGVDDLSAGRKENLKEAIKNRDFHFINKTFDKDFNLELPRLDYAFFTLNFNKPSKIFIRETLDFLEFINRIQKKLDEGIKVLGKEVEEKSYPRLKPKVVFISSINLYKQALEDQDLASLKEGEIHLAKFSRANKLNARIIRLAPLFGPRMHFREKDPLVRLIKLSLINQLQEENTSLEFSTRALFIDDAISLILKTAFSGSTAHKIYDGALLHPIKIAEVKQILIDPVWFESQGLSPSKLPPWPTPNLERTIKELSWLPKTDFMDALKKTLSFFSESGEKIVESLLNGLDKEVDEKPSSSSPELSNEKKELLKESIVPFPKKQKSSIELKQSKLFNLKFSGGELAKKSLVYLGMGIIFFGFIFPLFSLSAGAFTLRSHLVASRIQLEKGNFDGAILETERAKNSVGQIENLLISFSFFKRVGLFNEQILGLEEIAGLTKEGIQALNHGTLGLKNLHLGAAAISGEEKGDPEKYYQSAQLELQVAANKMAKVTSLLKNKDMINKPLPYLAVAVDDLEAKLLSFEELINKTKTAAILLPEITGLEAGKKSYLVLLQNNFELRPTGGLIEAYAVADFEKGRIVSIKADEVANLDNSLKEVIEPPIELKNDLGETRFFLKDSNFEADFPTAARQAEFFYTRETGQKVNGIIALDLAAASNLVRALGGLDLPDLNKKITSENLLKEALASSKEKNFSTVLLRQLLNNIFFLSHQNWSSLSQAFGQSLSQKHLLIYLAEPQTLSLLASQNWAGILPRGGESKAGEFNDILAINEANFGKNKANYYLERKYELDSSFGKEGEIKHHLVINYKNNSPSQVFPGGKYKSRIRIYLPAGSKLTKAALGEINYISKFQAFSDYNRSGFSALVEILPKEQKSLILEYELGEKMQFIDEKVNYSLLVLKQPGTFSDPFEWDLTYPINFSIDSNLGEFRAQEIIVPTSLSSDLNFELKISQR